MPGGEIIIDDRLAGCESGHQVVAGRGWKLKLRLPGRACAQTEATEHCTCAGSAAEPDRWRCGQGTGAPGPETINPGEAFYVTGGIDGVVIQAHLDPVEPLQTLPVEDLTRLVGINPAAGQAAGCGQVRKS